MLRADDGAAPVGSSHVDAFWRRDVASLDEVLRHLSASLAPAVVEHETAERGHVPVFVDGTGIEVDGRLFEHAARLCTGERGYWLHGIFVGGLRVGGRLRPGGDVACGWKGRMKRDLAPLLPPGTPVWVHCDAACYRGEFVEHVSSRGWDYSVSVTDASKFTSDLDIEVLAYIRTRDGFLTAVHDVAPADGDLRLVAIFNPGSNRSQASRLRLVNPTDVAAEVVIRGTDDRGGPGAGDVVLTRRYEYSDTRYFDRIVSQFDADDGVIHGLFHRKNASEQCFCPACLSRASR